MMACRRLRVCVLVFLVASLSMSCSHILAPKINTNLVSLREGQYKLDPKHTAVLFKVNHMGFSKFVGRFESVQAELDFDPANIESARLQAVIEMGSVNVNNSSFAETLKGRKWFNVDAYPQAVFTTKSVSYSLGNDVVFNGELTFLGVTRAVALRVHFNGGANNLLSGRYTIGFAAETRFKRSEFGLDKHLGLVGNEVEIEVHAEFQRIR